jgi:hypothetical protein
MPKAVHTHPISAPSLLTDKRNIMKTSLILAACLTFAVCHGQEGQNQNDVLRRLDAIEKELKKGPQQLRWATVDRLKISTAVFAWSQEKLAQSRTAEALPPETEAKVQEYETMRMELLYKDAGIRSIPTRPLRRPAVPTIPGVTSSSAPLPPAPAAETDNEYEALKKRVAAAKAPVAEIVERRERQAAQLRAQYTVESLAAEYAKDRYDVVVDSREKVIYQNTGVAVDITEGILTLFKEKTKQ